MGKPQGRRSLERPRRRWEDNIKMDREVGWGHGLDRSDSERDRWRVFVNAVMKLWVPQNAGNFLSG